jgi:hypothetical protein
MPTNPYDDLFDKPAPDEPRKSEPVPAPEPLAAYSFDPGSYVAGPDALDAILDMMLAFNKKAEGFSQMLSKLRVVDHEVKNKVARIFFVADDPHERGNLAGEKQYHDLQIAKFNAIIAPMRTLAEWHLAMVKQFNGDIDTNYFNPDKTEREVASEKSRAMDGIDLQRKILADAYNALQILTDGLADTERRLEKYVNAGGINNISSSEYELIVRKREALTSGLDHHFDYTIFDVNLLDKTAFSLGIYLKETSAQYLKKIGKALDA